jgi:Sec-independent protein secretion pathway component TatC
MLPTAIPFLVSILGVQTLPVLNYINFVATMFWIGMAFETPLVVYALRNSTS